ncbi:MAG: molybdopterin molybdotransferase MoeA [Gammaproteobacteria bacterium]|jgi:molybdopterin molybdotransferase|nr:molybdopterin molybdotransferase MoeA [Gammaproteobacteria bacterium]
MSCCDDEAGLLSLEQALATLVSEAVASKAIEQVAIEDVLGRVLAQDIVSSINVPPANNSAMDGYALRWQDYAANKALPVSQRIAAGNIGEALQAGTVARIFTGGEIPPGADVVVKQEDTRQAGDKVMILNTPAVGDHIRPAGQDIRAGAMLVAKGTVLSPRHIGILASVGCAMVPVYQRLHVSLVNTGDELVMPGEVCGAGKIYNSNYFTMRGFLLRLGCEISSVTALADSADAVYDALLQASQETDLVITTGGVSVGEEDHVKHVVGQLGQIKLWRLAIKPGKPLAYGDIQGTPFIGLPGNPVAAAVTFLLLAKPYIRGLQGASYQPPQATPVIADFTTKAAKRQVFLRANVSLEAGKMYATPLVNQSSGALSSTVFSDGLLVVPAGASVAKGDVLDFLPYSVLE